MRIQEVALHQTRVAVDSASAAADAPSPAGAIPRLFFIDHLRAALVILVVLHHVALVYGAAAPFYYVEPPSTDPLAYLILLIFALTNQAWFMGALFLIAGYFTPRSFERKGPAAFLKGRLVRLGIPLLVFFFVLNPISSMGYWQMPAELTGITTPLSWRAYPFLLGMGPLWFVALLLIFDFGYAGWRRMTANRMSSTEVIPPFPSTLGVGIFIIALAAASYLMRMVIPMGRQVLGFPTLSYLPQYLCLFILGTVAYRGDWLRRVSARTGAVGLIAAAVAMVVLFPLAISGRAFSLQLDPTAAFVGNGTWQSAVYAFWDSTLAVGLSLGAIALFRRSLDGQGGLGRFLSRQSYAVYVIHVPIVVFLALALRGIRAASLLKFVMASVLIVPVCFVVAYIIRKVPGVARAV
jgi:glucan biosynthesis protein C